MYQEFVAAREGWGGELYTWGHSYGLDGGRLTGARPEFPRS